MSIFDQAGKDATRAELKLLSVAIPARNEADCIASTVEHLFTELHAHNVPHEIIVVDDNSSDGTHEILTALAARISNLTLVTNRAAPGFGRAIVAGLDQMRGDAVVIMMADESDDCRDVVQYWNVLRQGYDCVFGSRFVAGGRAIDYPLFKLFLNRLANWLLRLLFNVDLNDTTNAFKGYRREAIEGCRPLVASDFSLTVELPLKAIVRGYSWKVVPVIWRNRRAGDSKLRIREMGSRYFAICMSIWLEKYFKRRKC